MSPVGCVGHLVDFRSCYCILSSCLFRELIEPLSAILRSRIISNNGWSWLALQCRSFIDDLLASHSTDLQQRAYELQVFLGLSPDIVRKVLPVNGSGEDIEVCVLLASIELRFLLVCLDKVMV